MKVALLRDSDFLATLGRAASKETAEKKKTPSPHEDGREKKERRETFSHGAQASERMEEDENDDYENQSGTYPPGFDGADGDGANTIDGTHISSELS